MLPKPCPAPVPLVPAFFAVGPPPTVTVTFDRALAPGVLANPNWFVRFNGLRYFILSAVAPGGATVILDLDGTNPNPGFNEVAYTPPPFDVLADCGTPAAAFSIGLA